MKHLFKSIQKFVASVRKFDYDREIDSKVLIAVAARASVHFTYPLTSVIPSRLVSSTVSSNFAGSHENLR